MSMQTIEDAIKQTKPIEDEALRAILNIIYTGNKLTCLIDRFLADYDLSNAQYNVLRILKGAARPVSTNYIKERLLTQNSDISRMVSRLTTKGLLNKTPDLTDKRLIAVELTLKGQDLLNDINIDEYTKSIPGLTYEECNQLNNLLDKFRNH